MPHFAWAELSSAFSSAAAEFDPIDTRVLDEDATGAQLPGSHAMMLWRGTLTLRVQSNSDARRVRSLLSALSEPDATFELVPADAPSGGETGVLSSVQADRRNALLTGMNPPLDSYLGFEFSGVRSLHFVRSSAGGLVRVTPAVPRSIQDAASATTQAPKINAVLAPRTGRPRLGVKNASPFEISFVQTLRSVS